MSKFAYTCEHPGCKAEMRLTEVQYAKRSANGRQTAYCDECLKAHDPKRFNGLGNGRSATKNASRDLRGVIVTAREQTRGELLTLTRDGTSRQALRAVCNSLDKLPGDWRILTISTPNSIYRDLQGSRAEERWQQGGGRQVHGEDYEPDVRARTEIPLLTAIGRLDLLSPAPKSVYGYPRTAPAA